MGTKLRSPFSSQPSRLRGQSSSLYAATRGSVQSYDFLEDGNTLRVRGMIFDVIEQVSTISVHSKNMTSDDLLSVALYGERCLPGLTLWTLIRSMSVLCELSLATEISAVED
jgi:hypothetical protein